ncbi:MAG: T9SS type A sorting domain-containing protein [Ignavibacteria bacterium]|nr:T9SS type A sorting domain-containing protein [Ignavibacteria bacterium]
MKVRILIPGVAWVGTEVTFEIDDVPYATTVVANGAGTNSLARFSLEGFGPGDHVVELVNPSCSNFGPITINCPSPNLAMEREWAEYDLQMGFRDGDFADDQTIAGENGSIPQETTLRGNYPNPFNPSTTISYALSQNGFVSLKVYNMLGQVVASLVDQNQAAGSHTVTFNASNLPSGIYIYDLNVNGQSIARAKALLVK